MLVGSSIVATANAELTETQAFFMARPWTTALNRWTQLDASSPPGFHQLVQYIT